PRFRLLLHEQAAASVSTVVLLLVSLPLVFRLGRRGTMRSFLRALIACAAYFVFSMVSTDLGARGTLHPVVAAWSAAAIFGARGPRRTPSGWGSPRADAGGGPPRARSRGRRRHSSRPRRSRARGRARRGRASPTGSEWLRGARRPRSPPCAGRRCVGRRRAT